MRVTHRFTFAFFQVENNLTNVKEHAKIMVMVYCFM